MNPDPIVTTDDPLPPAASSLLIRRGVELITLLIWLFIWQISLTAYEPSMLRSEIQSEGIFATTITHLTFPDAVSNVFLYLPFGTFLYWALRRNLSRPENAAFLTLAVSVCQSALIEVLQAAIPGRVSSLYDIVGNVMGMMIGMSLCSRVRRWTSRFLALTLLECRTRPQAVALTAYLLVLTASAALPFTFSFNAQRLKQAAAKAYWVPFAAADLDIERAVQAARLGDDDAFAFARWDRMKRWSRWTVECVSFVVLAWLLHGVLRGDHCFGPWVTFFLIAWMGSALAVAFSAMQFFIISRACDITDVLFRMLGLGIGMVSRPNFLSGKRSPSRTFIAINRQTLLKSACWLALVYIIFNALIPLHFEIRTGRVEDAALSSNLLPFFTYVQNRFDIMLDDMAEKLAAYFVFAALLLASSRDARRISVRNGVCQLALFSGLLSCALEIAQVFVVVRVPSLTDPILAVAGSTAGALFYFVAADFVRFAFAPSPQAAPSPASETMPALGLVDSLIASLMDSHSSAPQESKTIDVRNITENRV